MHLVISKAITCHGLISQVFGETGLADEFQPSIKASCVGGTMTIRVDTALPFDGVVHGPNRTEPGCSVTGKGGLKTYLKIDLGVPEGLPGSCGVKYNPVSEQTPSSDNTHGTLVTGH